MTECQIKLREAGMPYTLSCAKCGFGPCKEGQDYASLTARIRELEAQVAASVPQTMAVSALPPARPKSARYIETMGGTIMDRNGGRPVVTLELGNITTAEAGQLAQTILAALNALEKARP